MYAPRCLASARGRRGWLRRSSRAPDRTRIAARERKTPDLTCNFSPCRLNAVAANCYCLDKQFLSTTGEARMVKSRSTIPRSEGTKREKAAATPASADERLHMGLWQEILGDVRLADGRTVAERGRDKVV